MKVFVAGSRTVSDDLYGEILERLRLLPADTEIIHGWAYGVDDLAHKAALELGLSVFWIKPNYTLYGRYAPLQRTLRLLELGPELVIAWWDGKSKGTKYTIDQARKRGIEVEIYQVQHAGPGNKGEGNALQELRAEARSNAEMAQKED